MKNTVFWTCSVILQPSLWLKLSGLSIEGHRDIALTPVNMYHHYSCFPSVYYYILLNGCSERQIQYRLRNQIIFLFLCSTTMSDRLSIRSSMKKDLHSSKQQCVKRTEESHSMFMVAVLIRAALLVGYRASEEHTGASPLPLNSASGKRGLQGLVLVEAVEAVPSKLALTLLVREQDHMEFPPLHTWSSGTAWSSMD